jgi:hypothetical protein
VGNSTFLKDPIPEPFPSPETRRRLGAYGAPNLRRVFPHVDANASVGMRREARIAG